MRYYSVKRRIYILLVLLLGFLSIKAQYAPSFSHYYEMEPSFNPAAAGKQPKLNIAAAYAFDMAGFEHHPRTMYAGADMPVSFLNTYHGLGLQFMNDQIGLFTHQTIGLQYSLKKRLWKGMLGLGVQVGLLNEGFDGSKVDVEDSGDPALATSDVDGNGVDIGVGFYYSNGPWYFGLSALHLNSPKIELGETSELQIDPTYYLTCGYNIKLRNPFLTIKPSMLVKYDGESWRGDVTCRLVYTTDKKAFYGGVTYSPTNSVTFLIGGKIRGVTLGYSYELYTSALEPGDGSHELCIGYQMDVNLGKKGKNKHKSVRIL